MRTLDEAEVRIQDSEARSQETDVRAPLTGPRRTRARTRVTRQGALARHSSLSTRHCRICPDPTIWYFTEVSSDKAKGPRQWSFWVLMPISAPKPNSPPSVKRVEAFQ